MSRRGARARQESDGGSPRRHHSHGLRSGDGLGGGERRLRRSTNCGASRSHASHRPFVSPTCTSVSGIRTWLSTGSRNQSRLAIGSWACSRSSPRSMACARTRGSLHCSSASAFHDKRQRASNVRAAALSLSLTQASRWSGVPRPALPPRGANERARQPPGR